MKTMTTMTMTTRTARTHTTFEIRETSGKFPPLMIVSKCLVNDALRKRMNQIVMKWMKTGKPIVIDEPGVKIFQLIEGNWIKLS